MKCGTANSNWRHGCNKTPLYRVWAAMMSRCYREKDSHFFCYGAMGVRVCREWRTAAAFFEWAHKARYRRGLYLDRINNQLGYWPDNCRWVTPTESGRNRKQVKLSMATARDIRRAFKSGVKRSELAKHYGVCWQTIECLVSGRTWKEA